MSNNREIEFTGTLNLAAMLEFVGLEFVEPFGEAVVRKRERIKALHCIYYTHSPFIPKCKDKKPGYFRLDLESDDPEKTIWVVNSDLIDGFVAAVEKAGLKPIECQLDFGFEG